MKYFNIINNMNVKKRVLLNTIESYVLVADCKENH